MSSEVSAEGKVFVIAGKNINDINFINAWNGCREEAEKYGDTCMHIGEPDHPHFRIQDSVISRVLEKPIQGIAVSVTNSEYLAQNSLREAYDKNIPVVTFDSDLDLEHQYLRKGYIGPDNLEFGRALAREAQRYQPEGGNICLMSGAVFDPNLNKRILGVRRELSGNENLDRDQKLDGQNGWKEPVRCPWYNWDNYETSLQQMWEAIYRAEIDVFVSVGAWPVTNPELYMDVISPARQLFLESKEKTIIVGIGTPTEDQMSLLQKQYLHAYVIIDFTEMGRLVYHRLKSLSEGGDIPEWTRTSNRVLRWDDY
ncbi:hypothetical protein BTA51_03240 [Hahella sp. CCB-MM4]|uniref:substrate-binding domain-containing protein n=1 Tax=Hahella sp. (strain CCB-MM4) TaxID=1926491 RepID=UPI000BDA5353|nr:substrate-binding domain-containing protein [Hahella sp. CCB-MM4]OZG75406.1 hypothetical protein BTA51_03240 [Hahella sp. CCB-MM4]